MCGLECDHTGVHVVNVAVSRWRDVVLHARAAGTEDEHQTGTSLGAAVRDEGDEDGQQRTRTSHDAAAVVEGER